MHPNELDDLLRGDGGDKRWPPESEAAAWERIRDHRRYYRNDPGEIFSHRPELHVAGDAKATAERQSEFTPAGLGREIAKLSAALMFSEAPRLSVERDQDALDTLASDNDLSSKLHDAAEACAAEGSVGLRVVVDDDLPGPVVSVEAADSVLWRTAYGRTEGGVVVLTRERDGAVYRLLEDHGVGYVSRRLYKGTHGRLGGSVGLSALAEFRDLRPDQRTGLDRPTLVRWSNLPGDDSDLRGVEAMLDALDDATTLGRKKARASTPLTFVNRRLSDEYGDADLGSAILLDDALSPVEKPESMAQVVQGSMQAGDHQTYLSGLREQAISAAGYSLASWGLGEGGRADSGRALRLRQSRTLLTLAAKSRQAEGAISEALSVALEIVVGAEITVSVELGDGMPSDPLEEAQELSTLAGAGLISRERAVRALHPELSEEEVQAEVRALSETNRRSRISQLLNEEN